MADVNVRSIEALLDLRTGLVRYVADAQSSVTRLDHELRRMQAWLTERERYWTREVERWQRELSQAQAELRQCSESVSYDRDGRAQRPNCSGPQSRVTAAGSKLREATDELRTVRHYAKQVDEVGTKFTVQARRLSGIFQKEMSQAAELLNRSASQLQSYINTQVPGIISTGTMPAISGARGTGTTTVSSTPAIRGDGNQSSDPDQFLRFGELSPETKYNHNGYVYETDSVGRTNQVSGQLRLETGIRTSHQTEVGHLGKVNDQGGHLIGTQFGGSPEGFNLIPQNANLNQGAWKSMEMGWAKVLEERKRVSVDMTLSYPSLKNVRPQQFAVRYTIDGKAKTRFFVNRPGG